MASTAQAVVQSVAVAIAAQDGPSFAAALSSDLGNTALLAQLASGRPDVRQLCASALESPYDEMLSEHFHFLSAAARGDFVQAYTHQERAHACFHLVFEKDGAWSLPVLHARSTSPESRPSD